MESQTPKIDVFENQTQHDEKINVSTAPGVAKTASTPVDGSILPYILIAIIIILIVVLVIVIIKRPKPNTLELTKLQETFEASKKELKELQAKNKELQDSNTTLTSQIQLLDETNQELMNHSKALQSEIDERKKAEQEIEKMQNKKVKTYKERKQELFDKSNQYIEKPEQHEQHNQLDPPHQEIRATEMSAPTVVQESKAAPDVPKIDVSEDIDLDDVIN